MTPEQNKRARALISRLDNAAEKGDLKKLREIAVCDDREVRKWAIAQELESLCVSGNLGMVEFFVKSLKADPQGLDGSDNPMKHSVFKPHDGVTRFLASRIFRQSPRSKFDYVESVDTLVNWLGKKMKATAILNDYPNELAERGMAIVRDEAAKLRATLPTMAAWRRRRGFPDLPPTGNG